MPIKPPKCKTCGAEEYRHVCSGQVNPKEVAAAKPAKAKKKAKA